MQAVCDSHCFFTSVSVKYVGSTNDAIAFQNSTFASMVKQLPFPYHIIGDKTYVDSPVMMTPFEGINLCNHEPSKDSFNFYHSQLRITIERCFGIFVQRFGIFWRPLRYNLKVIMKIIEAACRLHNFCLKRRIPLIKRLHLVNENEVLINRNWRVDGIDQEIQDTNFHGSTMKQFILRRIQENDLIYDRNVN